MIDQVFSSPDGTALATLGQTARYLQMSVTTIERWARSGCIPSTVTPEGVRTFDPAVVVAILPSEADGRS